MQLAEAREGKIVQIRKRPTPFSFFTTYQGATREGVHSTLFATEPWNIIRHSLEGISDATGKKQALAFLIQARDFFEAARNSEVSAAKPLLLYYSFLNLVKSFVVKRTGAALGVVHHGLSEKPPVTEGAVHGSVSIDILKEPEQSAFVMFARSLDASLPEPPHPKTHLQLRSQDFLAQILVGHRVFCQAENIVERFISVDSIDYVQDTDDKEIWLRARAFADDFIRLGYPMTSLSRYLTGDIGWQSVKCSRSKNARRIIEAETTEVVEYGHRPSQVIGDLSRFSRSRLWRSVTAYPPYRKYYIYVPSQAQTLLNQLLTIYVATFYFGSITRYKPEQYDHLLRSPLGPFIFEFFANQPSQFLYLMASEFIEQEVSRAAIT